MAVTKAGGNPKEGGMEEARCRRCARVLVAEGHGLCPHCLLTVVLEEPELPTDDRFGNFEPVAVLGEGGMGVVYLAEQTHPFRRTVALKVLKPGGEAGEMARRFERERQSLARMEHPHIGRIYDAGTSERGLPYFAMEYVEGSSLTAYCDEGRLTLPARLELFRQVCEAVDHAHERGILHRDLKPGNILVARNDGRAQVKVIDFGLARLQEWHTFGREQLTGTAQIVGTPEYMSPERCGGGAIEGRGSDVYSLGMVLYELLAGVLPYGKEEWGTRSVAEVLRVIREVETPGMGKRLAGLTGERQAEIAKARRMDVAGLRRTLSGDLDAIVRQAVEKEAGRRYGTARELAADLERYEKREPVGAKRWKRWGLRGKWGGGYAVAVATGVVAATLAAGLAYRMRGPEATTVTSIVPYTAGDGNQTMPSFAPDGNRIVYVWDGADGENYDLYTVDAPGAPPQRLTTAKEDDVSPVWSPDGKSIAFLRGVDAQKSRLMLLDVGSGRERELREVRGWYAPHTRNLAWSPNGQWLAVLEQKEGRRFGYPYLYSVATGEWRVLYDLPDDAQYLQPAFSRDGRQLVYVRDDHTVNTVYLQRLTADYRPDGEPTEVPAGTLSMHPAFLPGGELLFRASLQERTGIWRMTALGATPEPLSGLGEDVENFAVSGDTKKVAITRRLRDVELYHYVLQSNGTFGSGVSLATSPFSEYVPQLSPDGKLVAFLSSRSGKQQVWMIGADGTKLRQLTFGEDVRGWPWWEDGGKQIRFTVWEGKQRRVFLVNAEGGTPVENSTDADLLYRSVDGKTVFFMTGPTNKLRLHRAPKGRKGESEMITSRSVSSSVLDPDGEWVYFFSPVRGTWALFRAKAKGAAKEELLKEDVPLVRPAVTREGVYYARRLGGRRYGIFMWNPATGRERMVLRMDRRPWLRISVSADGKQMVIDEAKIDGSQIRMAEIGRW